MILMHPERHGSPALAPGERVLVRLKPMGPGRYEGRTLRRIGETPGRILGVFKRGGVFKHGHAENRIIPTDRRSKAEWIVPAGQEAGAEPDEIVLAEPVAQHLHLGLKPARVLERLGKLGDARSISLIAIHTHDIPQTFPDAALDEAKRARGVRLGSRTDLRDLQLITIDGADARDFDDAVFAEPDPDQAGGFRLMVAIADVAHYVRPGSALDHAAGIRGNSVYFPDRVVPMLPEALSNGWCSLRPNEDRGCLFVDMRIDRSRPQDQPPVRPRPDAQRRPHDLRGGPGGGGRARRSRPAAGASVCRLPSLAGRAAGAWLAGSRPARTQGRAR